jgi:hypothetical protein
MSVQLKGKAIPVTGRGGPYGCETSRLPHFVDSRLTDGGEVVSFTRRPLSRPQDHRQLEGLGQLKNPVTSLRYAPATFRLVALPQSTTLPRAPSVQLSKCISVLRHVKVIRVCAVTTGAACVYSIHSL